MDVTNIIGSKIDNPVQTKVTGGRVQTEHIAQKESTVPDMKFTKENVEQIVDTLNSAARSVNQRVAFSYNEGTKRVIMKVVDSDTNEIVREIPPKEMIRFLEKMHELIGMIVDESR